MYVDSQKEPTVITFYEIAGIVLLTSILLVLFFPKQSIEKAISEEKSNYDLTLIYLQSIAQSYPKNPDNWLRLIDAQLRMGETEEAEKILKRLGKVPNIDKIYLDILSYQLIRTRYEKAKDPYKQVKLAAVLQQRLEEFLLSSDPSLWYIAANEAQSLHLSQIHYKALQKRLKHAVLPNRQEIKAFLYLGLSMHKEKEMLATLQSLLAKNPDIALYRLVNSHYLSHKAYTKAGETALSCYEKLQTPQCLLDGVQYLFMAKQYDKALNYLKRNQDRYIDNNAIAQKIIQLYLANNQLQKAHTYTLKVMRKRNVLP